MEYVSHIFRVGNSQPVNLGSGFQAQVYQYDHRWKTHFISQNTPVLWRSSSKCCNPPCAGKTNTLRNSVPGSWIACWSLPSCRRAFWLHKLLEHQPASGCLVLTSRRLYWEVATWGSALEQFLSKHRLFSPSHGTRLSTACWEALAAHACPKRPSHTLHKPASAKRRKRCEVLAVGQRPH